MAGIKSKDVGGTFDAVDEQRRAMPTSVALDNWQPKSEMRCATCMHYVACRCRRHSPRGQEGWPAVYSSDWCGDHKMNKITMAIMNK